MKMTDDEMDALLKSIELDEPSMSFSRNVMEQVALQIAPVALKTKVNKRIIYSFAAFFVACILGIFLYALTSSDFDYSGSKIDLDLGKVTDKIISSQFLQMFLMLDAVIALIWLDSVLRRRLA
jgi:hypothetical protein